MVAARSNGDEMRVGAVVGKVMAVDEGFMVKRGEAVGAEKLPTDGWRGGLTGREGCRRGAHGKGEKRFADGKEMEVRE